MAILGMNGRVLHRLSTAAALGHREQEPRPQSNRLAGTLVEEMPERGRFICRLPFPAASYRIGFSVISSYRHYEILDQILQAFDLQMENGDFYGSGQVPSLQAGGRAGRGGVAGGVVCLT